MRTVLNILNFVLDGFFTTLGWLIATVFSVLLVITLPLTRSCWKSPSCRWCLSAMRQSTSMNSTRKSNALLSAGGSLLNIIWLVLFGWWLCLSHIAAGIVQCVSIIGIPVGIANFKIAAIALWPVGRRVVSVEMAQQARIENARRHYHQR